ncbi:MAG TPA: radical SAM family heme chaperone HemW [Nitrospira sp.]|nr:radical SAM family heme chaperone HemW [Nitrospira sp.]
MTTSHDIGLYIHIPFCRQRCHFCSFYLEIARTTRMDSFRSALRREITLYHREHEIRNRRLQSIYFGGGTPTALPVGHLIAILDFVRATWPVSSTAEVTVESHPSTVTAEDLRQLVDAGFTRISFGAESMSDKDLASIGRPGNVQDTNIAVTAARAGGFANINLDLMYGLPGQTLDGWEHTLRSLLSLGPAHVSCYALTIEPGTGLAQDVAQGTVSRPDDGLQMEMEAAAEALLAEAGFTRYEISNYARPGAACRHNLLYWTGQDYLGLGPSAQSYVNGVRFGNLANLTAYVSLLEQSRLPVAERTKLSVSEQQRDALVFGLRLTDGVPWNVVQDQAQRQSVQDLIAQGFLAIGADRVRLTALGLRYVDTVAGRLF